MRKDKLLLQLYTAFLRIGGLTFGGGLTMLPMLKYELVEKKKWLKEDELLDCYAIGQCTPGIIAVNTATFVGYKKAGIAGGIFATLGMITPSLVIITIIAAFLQNFADYAVVKNAFAGIRVCVCVLILNAVVKLFKKSVIDLPTVGIFALVFLGSVLLDVSPILYIVIAGVLGIIVKRLGTKKQPDDQEEQK